MTKKAIVLVGHGSGLKGFEAPMKKVAAKLREKDGRRLVFCSYLKGVTPSVEEQVSRAVRRGANAIYVVPYFLLIGNHVRHDIPRMVRRVRSKWRGKARVILCPFLGYDPAIATVVEKRLKAAR